MTERPRPDVLFIGTGAIGFPMVQHIHRAGFPVVAVEPGAHQRSKLAAASIPSFTDLPSAPPADLVVVMVATPAQLEEVISAAVGADITGQL